MSVLTCPVCSGQMREMVREGVTIDTCTQCRGVWLDRGELEKLAGALAGQVAAPAATQAAAPAAPPPQDAGFWQRHQAPQAAYPPQNFPARPGHHRRDRDDDDDDDDHRRRGHPHKPSKLSRLMDFFD